MKKLIRIEAVNLRHIIDDTEDLSVRRGGGYMLLQAIRDIENKFKSNITPISTGASIGLFEITAPDADLVNKIRSFLSTDKLYQHATFMVDAIEDVDFKQAHEKLIMLNRWQQMQSPSFSTQWGKRVGDICSVDEVRPAAVIQANSGLSASCNERMTAGRDLRQDFYKREAGITDLQFTDNLEELCQFEKTAEYQALPANLNGKIAIFYADGNGFGKIQSQCNNAKDLNEWDKFIKSQRKDLLVSIINHLQNSPLARNNNKLRLETLMWGGDELLFAMPAWLGLEFAELFFKLTADWQSPLADSTGNYGSLTHGAGLVFAHHDAPIRQLQALAKNIAEKAKATTKQPIDESNQHRFPTGNTLAWVVLESFDCSGNDLEAYWKRVAPSLTWENMLLEHSVLHKLRTNLNPLKEPLPKSAMVRILRSLSHEATPEHYQLVGRNYESVGDRLHDHDQKQGIEGSFDDFLQLWKALLPKPKGQLADFEAFQKQCNRINDSKTITALFNILKVHAPAWTTILELWDYILPNTLINQGGRV